MDRYEVFSSWFFKLYALLWRMARPFLGRNKRLADGWAERRVPEGWARPAELWLQAASGGEARLALALLAALPRAMSVLICTWTRQGRDMLEKELPRLHARRAAAGEAPLDIQVRFAPLDDPVTATRAVRMVRPRLLALLETELWPGLMGACAENGVPVQIINGRLTRASLEGLRIISPMMARFPLQRVLAVSPGDKARFQRLFPSATVDTMPNIKFDQALRGLDTPLPDLGVEFAAPMILLASTRSKEESKLTLLILELRRRMPEANIVVAPRHMHRVEDWQQRLADLGLEPLLRGSLGKARRLCGRVLIWDRFGDLPGLYAAAAAVYVGGSLSRQGGQNFLEALSAGRLPCVGPHIDNFTWALGEESPPSLPHAGLLHICPNRKAVAEFLLQQTLTPRENVRADFRIWLLRHTGGARLAAESLVSGMEGQLSR